MRSFWLVFALVACSHPAPRAVPAAPAAPPSTPAPVAERFDERVRADFFDGLRGDQAAMDRAMKLCEDTLAKQPRHAEAMVWHGAGVVGRASLAFRTGDRATGMKLYTEGLAEMDRAVALAPDQVGVRIPRGAVVLAMAPFVPEPEKSKLVERGLSDYETTLKVQQPYFGQLTLHAREQLLYGLTDGYAQLGQLDRAEAMLAKMRADAAGSQLLDRAARRARGEAVDGTTPCEQCHQR
ncbi:MAG TPA: hypothetical protein VFQ53_02210 [Kofleriaceae bacterium]|nr:hypothetical protein [Kofleriaceae bacterium]